MDVDEENNIIIHIHARYPLSEMIRTGELNIPKGTTLASLLDLVRLGPAEHHGLMAVVNGKRIPEDYVFKHDEKVEFFHFVSGG